MVDVRSNDVPERETLLISLNWFWQFTSLCFSQECYRNPQQQLSCEETLEASSHVLIQIASQNICFLTEQKITETVESVEYYRNQLKKGNGAELLIFLYSTNAKMQFLAEKSKRKQEIKHLISEESTYFF